MRKFGTMTLATVLSLGLTACAAAREDPTAGATGAPAKTPGLSINSPIRDLLADPAAVAVLNKDMPGMTSDPRLDMVKSMSLKEVSQYPDAHLDEAKLKILNADLQAATAPGATSSADNTATATPTAPK